MKLYCEFCEPDENGDICHAGENDGCPNYSDCTAKYDTYGNLLVEESRLERDIDQDFQEDWGAKEEDEE